MTEIIGALMLGVVALRIYLNRDNPYPWHSSGSYPGVYSNARKGGAEYSSKATSIDCILLLFLFGLWLLS